MRIPSIADKFDYWDLRILDTLSEAVDVEDDQVKSVSNNSELTLGLRVVHNGAWSFVSSNNLDLDRLFSRALKLSNVSSLKFKLADKPCIRDHVKSGFRIDPFNVELDEKISRLKELNRDVRTASTLVKSAASALFCVKRSFEFYDSFDSMIFQNIVSTGFRCVAVGKKGNVFQRAYSRNSKVAGLELFYDVDMDKLSGNLADKLNRLLLAKHAPAGVFPVVIDSVMSDVFFHEAVCHACEADHFLENASVFTGSLGKLVGSELVNLNDGSSVKRSNVFYFYDDEGVLKRNTVLIEAGVLKNLLHSVYTASILGAKPTGNGRSMSPDFFPIPRMSTVVLKPGSFSNEELFDGIKTGVFFKGSTGGQVLPTEGVFSFGAEEAFLIKDGEVSTPLRDVSLSGSILSTLKSVSAVGNKSSLGMGGSCGKEGQMVPVDGLMPSVRIDEVMIGGRN